MNMKSILRVMGALATSAGATTSVVACFGGDENDVNHPQLNGEYAVLLGWYSNENTSIIDQVVDFDKPGSCIINANKTTIIGDHLFKEKLLIPGTDDENFKAKNLDASLFLADLGFISGSEENDYTSTDVANITNLVAKIKTANPGELSTAGTTDFEVAVGTCQIDIMTNKSAASLVTSYTINTIASNLNISALVKKELIRDKEDLKLTAEQGFKKGGSTSRFKLVFSNDVDTSEFVALLKIINTSYTTHFFDSPTSKNEVQTFGSEPLFLELHFGDVVLNARIPVEAPTS